MMLGSLFLCIAIFLLSELYLIGLIIISISMILLGGYMMTRSFTDADVDHPDYEQYQKRFHSAESPEE